jgi:hypothetical protein
MDSYRDLGAWQRGMELTTQVGHLTPQCFEKLYPEAAGVGRALNGMIKSIQRQLPTARSK